MLVLTGDGEMLMGMGSLATIAAAGAPNLAIAVLDNARYGETGSQHSHTGLTTDLAAVAPPAAGPPRRPPADMAEVEALRPRLRQRAPVRGVAHRSRRKPRHLPPRDGAYLAYRFRRAIGVAED